MLNWGNSPYNINSDLDAVTILRNFDKSVVMELSSQPGKFQKLQDEIWRVREENKRKLLQCESIKL